MRFKYQPEMEKLPEPCPPADYFSGNRQAFRWIFEEMSDRRNFLPQFFTNPKLENDECQAVRCQALGLSMYASNAEAARRFAALFSKMGQLAIDRFGGKVAFGELREPDGRFGDTDSRGHFTFHPSEDITFETRFTVLGQMD